MRIVIFGLALSSSWGNGHATTYRSLIKGLWQAGHEVVFFERDMPWYAQNRDAARFDYCTLHFYEGLESLGAEHGEVIRRADAVMVGSYVPDGPDLVDWLDGVVQGQFCFYDIDTPVTLAGLARGECEYLRLDQIPRFDVHFSFSGGVALSRLAELGARRPRPLYCSVDTELYRPPDAADAVTPHWRLGYMGTYAEDRQPAVERLLLEVARRRPEERFVVAGPGFDHLAGPGNVDWLAHVGPAQHRDFYASQAFTLNATRAPMVALGHSPSVRLFEAAACGCCIISDAWPGLDDVLEPGREVLVARDTDEVLGYLDEMTAEDRADLAAAARERVIREHSHIRRAEQLVAELDPGREMRHVAT